VLQQVLNWRPFSTGPAVPVATTGTNGVLHPVLEVSCIAVQVTKNQDDKLYFLECEQSAIIVELRKREKKETGK
jgi:hypothetical protein